jgi:hypothetical protein
MATTVQVPATLDASRERPALTEAAVRWTPARIALALTCGLRVFYGLLAALLAPWLQLDPGLIKGNNLTGHLMSRELHPVLYAFLGVWERFDTLWYIQIAHHGYTRPMATVFYPLYPALIRVAFFVTRSDLAAALLISTLASLFLFRGALRLFELDHTPAAALRAVLLWAVWPASFSFFAGYPDSLLCACIVWSLYFARANRWLPAGVLGLAAGFTKVLGCFLALPFLWIAWKRRDRRGIAAAALSVAGVAGFQAWLALTDFASTAQTYHTYWATSTAAPWTTLLQAVSITIRTGNRLLLMNLTVFVAVAAATLMRDVRFEYKLFTVAALCLFLTKHTQPLLQSTTRYSLSIFAAWPVLSAKLGSGLPFAVIAMLAFILNLLLFWTFLSWGLAV